MTKGNIFLEEKKKERIGLYFPIQSRRTISFLIRLH